MPQLPCILTRFSWAKSHNSFIMENQKFLGLRFFKVRHRSYTMNVEKKPYGTISRPKCCIRSGGRSRNLGGGTSNNLVGMICHCPGCIRVSQNLRKKSPLHPSSASLVDDFYYLVQWFQVQRKRTVSVVAY